MLNFANFDVLLKKSRLLFIYSDLKPILTVKKLN
jgi:hypothetical protein